MVRKDKTRDTEIRGVQQRWVENVQRIGERKVVEKVKRDEIKSVRLFYFIIPSFFIIRMKNYFTYK